jgi:hypothetical protein
VASTEIHASVIDRSDPHARVCWAPPGHERAPLPEYPNGRHFTEIEELRAKPHWHHRTDVAMVTAYYANGKIEQLGAVYFTREEIKWYGLRQHFTRSQVQELEAMRQKLIEVSKEYPEMGIYLGDRHPGI